VRGQAFEVGSVAFAAVLAQLTAVRQMLVLGMIERWHGSYYNTALVIAGGQVVGRYRKTFLTTGESVFEPGDAYPCSNATACGSGSTSALTPSFLRRQPRSRRAQRTSCWSPPRT
jgi:predicted amidohydrolase